MQPEKQCIGLLVRIPASLLARSIGATWNRNDKLWAGHPDAVSLDMSDRANKISTLSGCEPAWISRTLRVGVYL
jgi:hypothetical protein